MTPETAKLQDALVYAVIGLPLEVWERIVVNFEMQNLDEGFPTDSVAFYVSATHDGDFRIGDIPILPREVIKLFVELNKTMSRLKGDHWNTCDLVIEKSGKYNFKFSYDPPKRLNGVFDDESLWRFNRYLETYKAEHNLFKT